MLEWYWKMIPKKGKGGKKTCKDPRRKREGLETAFCDRCEKLRVGGKKVRRFLTNLLCFVLIAIMLMTNTGVSALAQTTQSANFYQTRKIEQSTSAVRILEAEAEEEPAAKEASSGEAAEEEDTQPEATTATDSTAPEATSATEQSEKEDTEEEKTTGEANSEQNTASEEATADTSVATKPEEDAESSAEDEADWDEDAESEDEEDYADYDEDYGVSVMSTDPSTKHDITMPDGTSHYFLLQKNSKKVSAASGANLIVKANAKEAAKYIYESYPNGKRYNFTPRFTSKTTVSVGGGTGGGVSIATVKKGSDNQFGDVRDAANKGLIASKAFNLNKCTANPYALYTNVGTWYDYNTGRTYGIDLKLTITGYKFPGASIRKQLANQELKAPYMAFHKDRIGFNVMGTDYVDTRIDFYYTGTQTAVSGLKGIVQYCDIDAQQGVDFGSGFEKVVMFNTKNSKLQYHSGLLSGSKGYVSSRVVTDLTSNDANTTAMGIFSGSSLKCRWTVAKCDHEDTGGNAKYAVKGGYGIPAETSQKDAIAYYWSNSRGFLGIQADVGIVPIPDAPKKTIYTGNVDAKKSETGKNAVTLTDRDEVFTYVVSAAVPSTSNINKAKYTKFILSDKIDSLLSVKEVKVYADEAVSNAVTLATMNYKDVSSLFTIATKEETDHRTSVTVTAKAANFAKSSFYGRSYFLHIKVAVKSDVELQKIGKSIENWYQSDESMQKKVAGAGSFRGSVAVDNRGKLTVSNNMGSSSDQDTPYVVTKIPMAFRVKKLDEESGKSVAGVVFGLFGGADVAEKDLSNPILKATTDEAGNALFTSGEKATFYLDKYGDGPYCVKELSVPETYKNVWSPSVDKSWTYVIPSLKARELVQSKATKEVVISEKATVTNHNVKVEPGAVKVYKKSKDTGAYLSGAEFMLYAWSESAGAYKELSLLKEETEEGRSVYKNEKALKNTMDNLGKYKITEKKAPKGCILTGQEWLFTLSEKTKADGSNIVFVDSQTERKQTGALVYKNPLQKAQLLIVKRDDVGESVSGATFTVKAAEDIYAPWDQAEEKPLDGAQPLVSKGTVVDSITTGEDGIGQSTKGAELYIGKYTVQETGGAPEHIKGEETYEVALSYGLDPTNALVTYRLDASNTKMRPSFSVAKLADRTVNEAGEAVAFDKKTGRYTESKQAGTYGKAESVDYAITVTNTGNVPLYDVKLTDDMDTKNEKYGQALSAYADMETATFVVPTSGKFKSEQGDFVEGTLAEESDLILTLDHLNVGDSVQVHVKVTLKEEAKDAWQLLNIVYGSAEYENNKGDATGTGRTDRTPVPTKDLLDGDGNSLVEDRDRINIPGKPDEKVTKTADRTEGITIEDGEIMEGEKVAGLYQEGEKVIFSILVKNSGEAALKNVTVKEEMGESLKKVVDLEKTAFALPEAKDGICWLTTAQGKKISVKETASDEVILCTTGEDGDGTDRLYQGDYVELCYETEILPGMANLYHLENTVHVNGWYFDGEKDREVEPKKDRDEVEVPGVPEARAAKLADKTKGVSLEDGRYDSEAKISGVYENGSIVTYKITVTNSGTANLVKLLVKDEMSEELANALKEDSVSFVEKTYTSAQGREVRTSLLESQTLALDFLAAGDSVDVYLKGEVREDIGNLFALKNVVTLTAQYHRGNEEARKKYEEYLEKQDKQWELTYHSNNEAKETVRDSETPAKAGTKISINGNGFSYEGHTFVGWNTKPDGSGESVRPDESYRMAAENITLYAQWSEEKEDGKKNPVYNLFYHSNNKEAKTEADEENSALAGTAFGVNKNRFSYDGYTFTGWNTKKDGSGKAYAPGDTLVLPAKNVTLYAQWEKKAAFKLTYDANNESGLTHLDAETPCESGAKVHIDGNPYTYQKGKTTYSFTGWNTRPDGSGESLQPGAEKEIQADTVLYAQWKAEAAGSEDEDVYKLFYRANNGTAALSVDAKSPAKAGTKLVLEENLFTYVGHRFVGWNTKADGSGTSYKSGDTLTLPEKDTYLYAIWEETAGCILTYHSNLEEAQTRTDAETPVKAGEKITVDGNAFYSPSQGFVGWNTEADGSGSSYAPGDAIALKEDAILYAQWTKSVERYRLLYSSNYPDLAQGKENEQETDGETPAYAGTKIKINANPFRRDGYTFTGWNTEADGGGSSYAPKDSYTMANKDGILYAQWEKVAEEPKKEEDETGSDEKPDAEKEQEKEEEKDDDQQIGTTVTVRNPTSEETKKAIEEAYEQIKKLTKEQAFAQDSAYEAIPVTELMTDYDHINVPGTPGAKTAKLADKTTGATLENGRYSGSKKEGIYEYGDAVDYTITLTNSGTADLYNLIAEDTMSEKLLAALKTDSIALADGEYVTKQGDTVVTKRMTQKEKEGTLVLSLDHLKAGDSVEIHVTAAVKSGISAQTALLNVVKLTAEYETVNEDGEREKVLIPETEEMTDDDKIGVGIPNLAVAKMADKTKGITLTDGRYSGDRKYGTYLAGENVKFTITVTNRGKGSAKNVEVAEQPSDELKRYVNVQGFSAKTGDSVRSKNGETVKIVSAASSALKLDQLNPSDSVQLTYTAKVKKTIKNANLLNNTVTVQGENKDKSKIPMTEEMTDSDKINLKGKAAATAAKPSGGGTGSSTSTSSAKTGDKSPIALYAAVLLAAFLVALIAFARRRKRS